MAWTCPRCETVFPEPGLWVLAPKERRVLQGLVDGQVPKKIAADIGMSPNTIRTHIQNLYTKLGVHSQVQAVVYAIRHGMSPSEPTQ